MERLTAKDKATLITSIIAIILSGISLISSTIGSNFEKQRTLRSQLTDVLSRIISVGVDHIKMEHEISLEKFRLKKEKIPFDTMYIQNIKMIHGQENGFLLQQARYIAEQISELVTPVEFNTIALASANAGELEMAEIYFLKSIRASNTPYLKSSSIRGYAAYLFAQNRHSEARKKFNDSITCYAETHDLAYMTNGFTYQMWLNLENSIIPPNTRSPLCDQLLENAKQQFSQIKNPVMRDQALQGLFGMLPQK